VPSESTAASEDRIGAYRFVRLIHPGATSVVMEVVDDATQKRFALKQLLASRAEDRAERKTFEHEAKLGMELRHPNLVRAHAYVKDPEQPYFVMELFPSYHLKLPIARPSVYPMPKAQLHRIIEQAASGLAYMHDKGWTHRDVKPENILANKSGEARLIDYALALRVPTGLRKLLGGKTPRQGTPSYIAPEQIRCDPPSPLADIYSFGITCYELVCGRPPFRANSLQELLNKHLQERPMPMSNYCPQVTQEFNDLVLKMLAKRPADRLASLDEFLSRFRSVRVFRDDPAPHGMTANGMM
jgi:serine/threonine protein kinase